LSVWEAFRSDHDDPTRTMTQPRARRFAFKPRARLLALLGDQLIRDPGIAVFELVKNAYDADASTALVRLKDLDDPAKARIIVEDDGSGMDWDTVAHVWLEPGTDFRAKQRAAGLRTPKYRRLPLGEKGVGRFAAHKLGRRIRLTTRKAGQNEVIVSINWDKLETEEYLQDARVLVKEREPKTFTANRTGTRLLIRSLRHEWTRGMTRDLHRSVMSICSPFGGPDDFKPSLTIEPDTGWLEGLLDVSKVLEQAPFVAHCKLSGRQLVYDYKFSPPSGMDRIDGRVVEGLAQNLPPGALLNGGRDLRIGPMRIDLHIFDLDPQVLAFGTSDKRGLRDFLSLNGGVRVYRDGMRVYDYGEPGNDWLGLGQRRVNVPARRISSNLVIGAVTLSAAESQDLLEKTNREGFVDNEAYRTFRSAVLFSVEQIEAERLKDKERIRRAYAKARQKEPVLEDLATLRKELERRHLVSALGAYVDAVEQQFVEVRDRLLTAAGAGLTLAVVIHELEKGVAELTRAVERDVSINRIKVLAKHLHELIDGLAYLTRKSGVSQEKATRLIRQALFNTEYRLRHHRIEVFNGFEHGDSDFTVKCVPRLIVASLMNLIDNSIWWLENKGGRKRIYIGTTKDLDAPAIVVADNGPGFVDPPEYLVQPFLTRKPGGMGLGLHLVSEIMKAQGGRLVFPEHGDVSCPPSFDGAVVALVFASAKWTD